MNRFIQAPAKPVPDFVLTTVVDGVERETVFMDDLMLAMNDVFDSAVVLDRPTIIAKSTAIALGLEFACIGKILVKGKMIKAWTIFRQKLYSVCQE